MNFEVGSAASYREFIISPLGAYPRRLLQAIPESALLYLKYPFRPIVEGRDDYTGWTVIGRTKNPLTIEEDIGLSIQCLFQTLSKRGWEIPDIQPIYVHLSRNEVLCLFLRKHYLLREMIILYPATATDMLYPKGRPWYGEYLTYTQHDLEF